jgi:hypothetical protein
MTVAAFKLINLLQILVVKWLKYGAYLSFMYTISVWHHTAFR